MHTVGDSEGCLGALRAPRMQEHALHACATGSWPAAGYNENKYFINIKYKIK